MLLLFWDTFFLGHSSVCVTTLVSYYIHSSPGLVTAKCFAEDFQDDQEIAPAERWDCGYKPNRDVHNWKGDVHAVPTGRMFA